MSDVFIIAEAGVNHNGSLETACRLIDLAAGAGADAVKFQTFKAKEIVSRLAPKAVYQERLTPADESHLEMLQKLALTEAQHEQLSAYCGVRKIEFLSSPFDLSSIDLLVNRLQVSRLKIASGEITNAPLLLQAARSDKKIILSTGMSNLGEVENALGVLAFGFLEKNTEPSWLDIKTSLASPEGQSALREKVTLLHCSSEYPAPFNNINLRAMDTLRQTFGLQVGYSDHTPGIAVAIAAAARGAAVIEKHFTVDRNLPGPDHRASLEPDELKTMVASIRQVEMALGLPLKAATPAEIKNSLAVRKSLVAARTIRRGEAFTVKNLTIKRPGTGISPFFYWEMLGKKAARDYAADDLVEI